MHFEETSINRTWLHQEGVSALWHIISTLYAAPINTALFL
jgi:hypothetical protein